MNKKNILAIISAMLILFALLLGTKVSGSLVLGEYLFKIAGLPVLTNGDSGFYIPGLFTILSLTLGVFLFRLYFRKYRTRQGELIFIGFLTFSLLYLPVYKTASVLIKSHYNGLKAIEYIKAESTCSYSISPSNEFIECNCSLKFINYSNRMQKFQIKPAKLDEQIKEVLQKHFNVKVTDLEYDDEIHSVTLPPATSGIFSGPVTTQLGLVFRFKKKENNLGVNGGGGISSPSITIFNENETRSIEH